MSCEVDIDFDSAEVIFTLKERLNDSESVAQLTIDNGITRDLQEAGRYVIKLPDAVTAGLEPDRVYYWDLVLRVGADSYELDSGFIETREPVNTP